MNTVTFMGNPLHLEGNLPVVGQKAPEFTVCNNGLEPRSLKDYAVKIVVLVSVPSLLARAIFVVAPDGTLAYSQLVPEVTNEPDYDAVLEAVKKLA